jgi:hypothetical protein
MKLSRGQLAEFLTERGYKTSIHLLNRLCQPSVNLGPPTCGRWGSADLYDDEPALAWAEARAAAAKDKPRHAIARHQIARKPRSQRRA